MKLIPLILLLSLCSCDLNPLRWVNPNHLLENDYVIWNSQVYKVKSIVNESRPGMPYNSINIVNWETGHSFYGINASELTRIPKEKALSKTELKAEKIDRDYERKENIDGFILDFKILGASTPILFGVILLLIIFGIIGACKGTKKIATKDWSPIPDKKNTYLKELSKEDNKT